MDVLMQGADVAAARQTIHAGSAASRTGPWWIVIGCCIGYLLVLAAWSAPSSPGGDDAFLQPEQRIKVAFLYKFLSYVEWPADALRGESTPIVIGVLGDDDIANELRLVVANRRVGQHPVDVRRVDEANALDGVRVLFVDHRERAALARLAGEAHRRSVLLVTDFDGALRDGSVINLVVVDNRVRFEVSLEAAEQSALKLSSRMLAVALWVQAPQ